MNIQRFVTCERLVISYLIVPFVSCFIWYRFVHLIIDCRYSFIAVYEFCVETCIGYWTSEYLTFTHDALRESY